MDRPTRPLAISPCLSECAWGATGEELDGERLFACRSCGSEWVRSQSWTPIDWQGEIPEPVLRERQAIQVPREGDRTNGR